jgi:hypothetical protein
MEIGKWVKKTFFGLPRYDRSVSNVPELTTLYPGQRIEFPRVTRHNVCNPTILARPDGFAAIVRGCNYDLGVRGGFFYGSAAVPVPDSQSYLYDLAPDLSIRAMSLIEDRPLRADEAALDGIEDLRLFVWRGAQWVIGSACNYIAKRNTMMMARLEGSLLRDAVFFSSPDFSPKEKNWAPVVQGDDLFFVYTHHPLRVLRYDQGRLVPHLHAETPARLVSFSGSSALMPYGDGFVGVAHHCYPAPGPFWRIYQHCLVDYGPDFRIRRVGPSFRFENDGVEFCAGLALTATDAIFSYGVNDKKAVLFRLPLASFETLLG